MFITAVCVIFLIKLRWPKNKSLYDSGDFSLLLQRYVRKGNDAKSPAILSFFLYPKEPII